MNPPSSFFLPALLGGLAAAAAAQEPMLPHAGAPVVRPAAPIAGDDCVPIHTAAPDQGIPYGTWAAGTNYKVSFHDGATFVPYLGRDYPRLQSLRWTTMSAAVGTEELATAPPKLTYRDFRAEYDLGGVVEAWDVRPAGLEQTFVLRAKPAAHGDLVIRGAIATALHATPRSPRHDALVFADDDGRPIVSYGAATAIDANGRTQPMTTAIDEGRISLRLDAGWLAQAAYPVTVDPLLGNVFMLTGDTLGVVDLARDTGGASGKLWLAAERWAAASDADLRLRRIDDDGLASTQVFTDLTASWSSLDPSLGVHLPGACTLLAFVRDFAATNTRRIRLHKHDRADFTLQTVVAVIDTGDYNAWRPDVATDLGPATPQSLPVVFQREHVGAFSNVTTSGIWASVVDLAGIGNAGAPFAIAQSPDEDQERPAIGKVHFGQQVFTVAWQAIGNNGNSIHVDWDIALRRVDRAGAMSNPTWWAVGNTLHEMAPQLGGFGDTQLVVYGSASTAVVGARPSSSIAQNVFARRYDWNGAALVGPAYSQVLNTNADARVELCGIDADRTTGSHYAIAYRSTVTQNVYLQALGYRGGNLSTATVFEAPVAEVTTAGAVAYDDDAERFVIAYGVNAPAIAVAHVDAWEHPAAPAPVTSGIGCSAATLSWLDSQLIGDENVRVRLANLPAGAVSTVLVGTATASVPLIGVPPVLSGCWLLVPNTGAGSLGFLSIAVGPTATWFLDVPEWLDPMTLHFQGIHFDAAGSSVLTTQRLSVPLVK